jgi:DNA-binding XRE family transcriptional regulator
MTDDQLAEVPLAAIAAVRKMVAEGLVRQIREDAGLTQADIARKVGVGRSAVSQWEKARRIPSGRHSIKYAMAMAECLAVAEGMGEE